MKKTEGYLLEEIHGNYYLLPYGQMIAEHRRSMQLNEAGVFLWKTLSEVSSKEELFLRFARFCEAEESEYPLVRKDMNEFLNLLTSFGMLKDEKTFTEEGILLKISGIYIRLIGPEPLFSKELFAFLAKEKKDADLTICLHVESGSTPFSSYGKVILHTNEFIVCESEDAYLIQIPDFLHLKKILLSKDGSSAQIYCYPSESPDFVEHLFHAIRFLFLYCAQKREIFAIHSASVLYKEKAWLFSAPSGTGKSTHTNLWKDLFSTPIINGDLNLLSIDHGKPMVHGLPWCGTSGIFSTESYPLGGIFLLKQAPKDELCSLSLQEKCLNVMQRFISPAWTKKQMLSNLNFSKELEDKIILKRLLCTKNPSAALLVKDFIDRYLNSEN